MSAQVAGLPPLWLAPGAVTDPRALARFVDLSGVPLVAGPVEASSRGTATGRTPVHALGVGGLSHADAPAVSVAAAEDLLRWASARGLGCALSVRGRTTGELASVVERVRRGVDADALVAVEVDLRTADEQTVLKSMARVREAAPRDLPLLARLAVSGTDLVARARSAVAGGASAVVVCGQVPLGPGRWWSGPSTAEHTLTGVRLLAEALVDQRWPGAALIASGGVHDPASATRAVRAGATGVQVGTALWADPTLLDRVREATWHALSAHGTGPVPRTTIPTGDPHGGDGRDRADGRG